MTFNDYAITLIRKPLRESGLIASVYTKTRGRMHLRFPGVKKHKGKLKAFAELFVWSEIRVYLRSGAHIASATGGKIHGVFGEIRKDYAKTCLATYFCELMMKFTPIHQPNREKYHLILSALNSLNDFPLSHAMRQAFTLRLMKTAGFGVTKPPLGIDAGFWQNMHEEYFHKLNIVTPAEKQYLQKTDYIIERFFNKYFDHSVKSAVKSVSHFSFKNG